MFADFLSWITSADGGAFILVSWLVAWGLEDLKAWHDLSSKARSLIVLVVAALTGVGARALQMNPELVAIIEPWFEPVAFVIGSWLATQTAHKLGGKKTPNKRITP